MDTLVNNLRSAFQSDGLEGGLAHLNGQVPHRYTALYRLAGGKLKNIALQDKHGEVKPEYLDEVSLDVSFCQFVLRDGYFKTEDSSQDSRLDGHPYKGVMMAYHGVPVVDENGKLFGTLCHFDLAQRQISEMQFELLERAAAMLPEFITETD